MSELLTLPEVAKFLKIAERTAYQWVQTGRLPGFKLGTGWRFKRDDIEHFIEEQKSKMAHGRKEEET
jgi:excisionase family DNA binding protein